MGTHAPLVVSADDTTGALETAAACVDAGCTAVVSTASDVSTMHAVGVDLHVVDLRSRHLSADEAAARLRSVLERSPGLRAHKIDSTLRGAWAAEVMAVADVGRPVLIVPAFPAAGRTCVDGVVLVHGVPVHETAFAHDPRTPVTDARPASSIVGAVEVGDVAAARAAFADGARVVIADAQTDAHLDDLAAFAASHPELVIAGPAAAVTALVQCLSARRTPPTMLPLRGPVLAVSASQHPLADAQLIELAARGIEVIRPPIDARIEDADSVLAALARAVHDRLGADASIATLVVVGGDTAAAVIGDEVVSVDGTLGVGVAVGSVELCGRRLRLITKPGGFGTAGTLVDVLQDVR